MRKLQKGDVIFLVAPTILGMSKNTLNVDCLLASLTHAQIVVASDNSQAIVASPDGRNGMITWLQNDQITGL